MLKEKRVHPDVIDVEQTDYGEMYVLVYWLSITAVQLQEYEQTDTERIPTKVDIC